MNPEPRQREDYSDRQVKAARRVLVDLGQVLASFVDCRAGRSEAEEEQAEAAHGFPRPPD